MSKIMLVHTLFLSKKILKKSQVFMQQILVYSDTVQFLKEIKLTTKYLLYGFEFSVTYLFIRKASISTKLYFQICQSTKKRNR